MPLPQKTFKVTKVVPLPLLPNIYPQAVFLLYFCPFFCLLYPFNSSFPFSVPLCSFFYHVTLYILLRFVLCHPKRRRNNTKRPPPPCYKHLLFPLVLCYLRTKLRIVEETAKYYYVFYFLSWHSFVFLNLVFLSTCRKPFVQADRAYTTLEPPS